MLPIFIILSDIEDPQSNFQNFTFSECKDDLTGVFTSQPIAVVDLLTAPVSRLRAPSTGAPSLCPLVNSGQISAIGAIAVVVTAVRNDLKL